MSTTDINIRDPKKGFYAEVIKIPKDLEKQKTIKVSITERAYLKKYKRFYKKTKTYHVHCDLKNEKLNPTGLKSISLKDKVYCVYTRKISKTKSSVVYSKVEKE